MFVMVLAHVVRDQEQRMTEAPQKYDKCLLVSKKISLQTSKRRRSQNLFYVVYICKSPNKRVEVENILFIYGKGEGKGGCLEGGWKGISIYDCIDFASISFSS